MLYWKGNGHLSEGKMAFNRKWKGARFKVKKDDYQRWNWGNDVNGKAIIFKKKGKEACVKIKGGTYHRR